MEPEQYAKAALEIYLNNPAATLADVLPDEEISLEKALREDAMGYPENPWLQKAARTAPEVRDDSRSRRRGVLRTFLLEKIREGFSTTEIILHASKVNREIGDELRSIAAEI